MCALCRKEPLRPHPERRTIEAPTPTTLERYPTWLPDKNERVGAPTKHSDWNGDRPTMRRRQTPISDVLGMGIMSASEQPAATCNFLHNDIAICNTLHRATSHGLDSWCSFCRADASSAEAPTGIGRPLDNHNNKSSRLTRFMLLAQVHLECSEQRAEMLLPQEVMRPNLRPS